MLRKVLQSSLLTLASAMTFSGLQAQQFYNQTDRYLKYNSVWTFYSDIKYNFNTGAAASSLVSGSQNEGCASIAHPVTGALMFYSDGGKCWNSNNAVMPNGNNLLGNATGGYSTTQGVCIVPMPGSSQKYYLFSLQSADGTAQTSLNVYYSVVDMSLNGGLGDIILSTKNTLLDGTTMLGESMLAIQGNNCDVWLMFHTKNTPTFRAYHITTTGINTTPVISTTGSQIHGNTTVGIGGFTLAQDAYEQCSMTASPDRTKLSVSCQHVGGTGQLPVIASTGRSWGGLLCDFNASTGVVSNAKLIDTMSQYSAAFSPDNSKLYYTSIIPNSTSTRINQATISSNDSATIVASATVIGTPLVSDNLISIRAYHDSIYVMNPGVMGLDRINKPNLAGAACNYQSNAISFPGATAMGASLPAEIVGAADPDTLRSKVLDTVICHGLSNGVSLHPADVTLGNVYAWNDGSSVTSLSVNTAGTYWVKYGNSCHYRMDTFVVKGSDLAPVITQNGSVLSTTVPYISYQWYFNNAIIAGATSSTYTATINGAYTVVVSDATCTDTSAVFNMTTGLATHDVWGIAAQIKIFPNPAQDVVFIKTPVSVDVQITGIEGRVFSNVKDASSIAIDNLAAGIYLIRIYDKQGNVLKVEKLIKER